MFPCLCCVWTHGSVFVVVCHVLLSSCLLVSCCHAPLFSPCLSECPPVPHVLLSFIWFPSYFACSLCVRQCLLALSSSPVILRIPSLVVCCFSLSSVPSLILPCPVLSGTVLSCRLRSCAVLARPWVWSSCATFSSLATAANHWPWASLLSGGLTILDWTLAVLSVCLSTSLSLPIVWTVFTSFLTFSCLVSNVVNKQSPLILHLSPLS